jgi:hypothetical protein
VREPEYYAERLWEQAVQDPQVNAAEESEVLRYVVLQAEELFLDEKEVRDAAKEIHRSRDLGDFVAPFDFEENL